MPNEQRLVRERGVNVVILACAVSAGIHGALAPEHFEEGLSAGLGFVAAAVVAAAVAAVLTYRPTQLALAVAGVLFAGLIASYAAAVTTGVPVLHPEPEAVDSLALATKAVEAVGLAAAVSLLHRQQLFFGFQPKGTSA